MRNEKLDEFLYKNRLKSSDLVAFWGVTKGVVSQILNGTTKLPAKRMEELLNNPHGWDTSMLTESQEEIPAEEQRQPDTLDRLFAIVEDQRKDIATLLAMMKDKDEKIGEMRRELDSLKKGVAQSAVGSSGANVG